MFKKDSDRLVSKKITNFFSRFKAVDCRRGEILIKAGEPPKGIFYLKKGYVKMNAIFEDGRELTLNIYKSGSYFPMFWALTDIPNTYYFQAITEAQFYCAPKEKVLLFIQKNPDVLMELTTRILTGVSVLLNNIEYLLSGNSSNRVAAAILLCARRFGESSDGKMTIKMPLIHQDVANLAGITRETASIAMSELQKQEIISRKGHFLVILNMKRLENTLHIPQEEPMIPNTL
ncbi:Crp/Fnr family transcriptional regulator [Candidatus Daviesbacteria bacterium]|nr:Crp/Fnr family transcriptional regulator [Candidatus Daviesbacteria bacterium]